MIAPVNDTYKVELHKIIILIIEIAVNMLSGEIKFIRKE